MGPLTDLLRAVRVGDSTLLGKRHLEGATKCRVLCLNSGGSAYFKSKFGSPEPIEFRNETFCPGAELASAARVDMDIGLLERFKNGVHLSESWGNIPIPFKTIDELMRLSFDFFRAIWEDHINILSAFNSDQLAGPLWNFYSQQAQENAIKLGWGSGLTATTMALLLKSCPGIRFARK